MPAVLNHQQVEAIQAAIAVVSVYHNGEITRLEVDKPSSEGTVLVRAHAVRSNPTRPEVPEREIEILVNLRDRVADFDGRRCWLIDDGYYSVPVITTSSHKPFKAPAYVDLSSL